LDQNTDSLRLEPATKTGFAFEYQPLTSSRSDRRLGSSEGAVCTLNQAEVASRTAATTVGAYAVVVVGILEVAASSFTTASFEVGSRLKPITGT
jgi:hypothetical protein